MGGTRGHSSLGQGSGQGIMVKSYALADLVPDQHTFLFSAPAQSTVVWYMAAAILTRGLGTDAKAVDLALAPSSSDKGVPSLGRLLSDQKKNVVRIDTSAVHFLGHEGSQSQGYV